MNPRSVSIAPMLGITNSNFWSFMRLLTKKAMLYTEMIHCKTLILNPNYKKFLQYNPQEKPLTIQLGGNNPQEFKQTAQLIKEFNFDEVNINCGCPSKKVTQNKFGVCLMQTPQLVLECVLALEQILDIPISVKCWLGFDQNDSYEFLYEFIDIIQKGSKVQHFVIHCWKALLGGISTKKNRTIPQLDYSKAFWLMSDFPQLKFTINGQLQNIQQIKELMNEKMIFGGMIGRASYNNIFEMRKIDEVIFGEKQFDLQREEVMLQYEELLDRKEIKLGNYILNVQPALSLFHGERGNTLFRQLLSDKKIYLKHNNFKEFFNFILKEIKEEQNKVNFPHKEQEITNEDF